MSWFDFCHLLARLYRYIFSLCDRQILAAFVATLLCLAYVLLIAGAGVKKVDST